MFGIVSHHGVAYIIHIFFSLFFEQSDLKIQMLVDNFIKSQWCQYSKIHIIAIKYTIPICFSGPWISILGN